MNRMEERIEECERKIIEIISGSAERVSDIDELKNNTKSVAVLKRDSVNVNVRYDLDVLLVNGIE